MDTLVWDSNSKLYDSFEVSSIKRQLDSAVAGRCRSDPTLMMIAEGRKKKSKLSRSLQKLLRLVFGFKQGEAAWLERYGYGVDGREEVPESMYPVRWSGGGLASIPEVSEKGMESPDIDYSAVRRAVSERFTSSTSGGAVLLTIPAP
ncbi:uncharacterized protein LOC110104140 [Dendrobium catenatum]|uniref:uncharacterized protein LOC110104140 n=1 Tax=Dendrobium catenatum TaxID=906689 RepID=UPI0009F43543|nr:uncharacterized protein LOC110104140 [Dendrobium catenatum]